MKKKILILIIIIIVFSPAYSALAKYQLEMTYPEIQGIKATGELTSYLRYIYIYGLATIGLVALGALIIGGIMYMGAGSITSTEEAKKIIWGAIGGLLLGLSAYLILNTINPDLVALKKPSLEKSFNLMGKTIIAGGTETHEDEGLEGDQGKIPVIKPSSESMEKLVDEIANLDTNNTTVVINKGEKKMTIVKNGQIIAVADINIGTGDEGNLQNGGKNGDKITPTGAFTVASDKRQNQNGVYNKQGINMGAAFIGLSAQDENGKYRGIGIHASADDNLRPTNGCIRVTNRDAQILHAALRPGTNVRIIN